MKEDNKISGIYKIKNKLNGKMYIGLSVDIYDRWYEHIRELNKKKHVNNYLQRAWNKYGQDSFEFEVIEKCPEDSLCEKEIKYIEYYDTYNNGYNLTRGGEGTLGRFHSEETKMKISKANKGRICINAEKLKDINHTNRRKIVQLALDGELIVVWDSLLDIHKHFKKDIRRSVRGCCNKETKRLTALGFIWMWKDEYDEKKFNLKEYLNNNAKNKNKLVFCKELNIEFNNIDEIVCYFREKMGITLNKRCVGNVISKENRKYKGYTFLYRENASPSSL